MQRFCAYFLIVIAVLVSAGCVEIEVNTRLNENGSGKQIWRFTGTALLSSEIKKQVQNNRFFKKSIIRDEFKEGDYILEASMDFQDVSELKDADRDVTFHTQGFLIRTHTYTEVWKRTENPAGLLAQHARGVVPVTLRVQVELPGKITETNADYKDGSVARWSVSVTDLAASKMLVAKSRSWNRAVLIPGALALFLGITLLGFFVYSTIRKGRTPSEPPKVCASSGAKVPAASIFCNFCGNKMTIQE